MKRPSRILGIDPGTKFMGVAILDGERLVYHDTLPIPQQRDASATLRECSSRIRFLIETYEPDLIAIERMIPGKSKSAIVGVLISDLRLLAGRGGIPTQLFSPSAVKKFVTGYGWATKEEVSAAIVARWYPELHPYLRMRNRATNRFHQNRFDAIGVGKMAAER